MTDHPGQSNRAAMLRGFAFEDLIADLFSRLGYAVEREIRIGGVLVDMVVRRDDLIFPVELMISRAPVVMHRLVADAAKLRSVVGNGERFAPPLLVVGGRLTAAAKNWAQEQFDIRVWDLPALLEKATPYSDLVRRLREIEGREGSSTVSEPKADVELQDLVRKLEAHIETNQLTAAEYEHLCMSVFKHLFDPHLYGFEAQAETSDGGNRYDFICRIASGNPFWDGLRQDFRTKAILFECKNYEKQIGPDQVYSTERYLFVGALRTVCLLVSRLGPNPGAIRAAQGAMRESGKLVILLSNGDLIEMLKLKGQNGGPEEFLDKRIWDFVISLPR